MKCLTASQINTSRTIFNHSSFPSLSSTVVCVSDNHSVCLSDSVSITVCIDSTVGHCHSLSYCGAVVVGHCHSDIGFW